MTSFLTKIEAIHSKGDKHPGAMTKLKRALTTRPGKTLASKLTFLVASLPDLTQERSFDSNEVNQLFFTFSNLKTSAMSSLEDRLAAAANIAHMAPKVFSELIRLQKKNYLYHVQQKDMDDFKKALDEVVKAAPEIEALLSDLRRVKSETHNLGFSD